MKWYIYAKKLMSDNDIKQKDLIDTMGVDTRGAVGHYLSGRRKPSTEQLMALAVKLGTTLEDLISSDEDFVKYTDHAYTDRIIKEPAVKGKVPLFSLAQVGVWSEADIELRPTNGYEMTDTTEDITTKTFAVIMSGDSMEPEFSQYGDVLIVANWVAKELRLRTPSSHAKVPGELAIGLLLNNKYRCQVALNSVDVLSLKINQVSIPLVDVLYVDDEQLAIDLVAIESLAKQSVLVSSKSEYQPSTVRRDVRKLDTQNMYADWQKAYRQLLKKSPGMSDVWYSQQLAKKPIAKSRDANTIRRHMKG